MLRREVVTEYLNYYKIDSKVISIEDVAKILVKCKILDNRETKYNIIGFSFEELLYNELMDIKACLCSSFMILMEYSLYFEQRNVNDYMIEPIYQSLKFLIDIINDTSIQRKNCRYKNVVKTIIKYEKDFYGENLRNCSELEKEIFIKNDLIEHSGEILYNLQYYRLIDNTDEEKSEEYWNAIMKLVTTIDKLGVQKNIKSNKEMEESIRRKTLTYLTENSKKPEDIFEYDIK